MPLTPQARPGVGDNLSAAQQRFDRLLARIAQLTQRLNETRATGDAHRQERATKLYPLMQRQQALTQELAQQLRQHVQQRAALTVAQQRATTALLERLCPAKPTTSANHARWQSDSDPRRDRAAAKERRLARQAAKPKSAQSRLAQHAQGQAQTALRTVFRQLAKALHPDRESDPTEQQRKTALMSRVNAAYDRGNLSELLALQLELAQVEPQALATLAEHKVQALSLLLQKQLQALGQDQRLLEQQLEYEFALAPGTPLDAEHLTQHLAGLHEQLQQKLLGLEQDLRRVQTMDEFKRWLKAQAIAASAD